MTFDDILGQVLADRKFKRPFGATTPAAPPQYPPPAATPCPRRVRRPPRGLDRRRRMG